MSKKTIINKGEKTIDLATDVIVLHPRSETVGIEVNSAAVNATVTLKGSLSYTDEETANASWLTLTDSAGDDITGTLVAGTPLVMPISDVPRGMRLSLAFSVAVGEVKVTLK